MHASTSRSGIRVAYLTLEAPRQGQASYAHVFEIVQGLRRLGFPVDLYLPSYTDAAVQPALLRRFLEHIRLQALLIARFRRYDLVYVRGHNMAFAAALVGRLTGKTFIHEVNGPHLDITVTYPWTRHFNGLLQWLQRTQYRWAQALVPVTPQLQQWLRAEGCSCAIEVIPNGANTTLFNPQCERRASLPDHYVVFFGGFARWQGIPVMLDAVSDPAWPKDVSLVIVGDGQMAPEVREAATQYTNLRYLGRLPYADVGSVVAGSMAGLVPKTREDDTDKTGLFPIKLFEILACGVPAVVSDYPGQADLVRAEQCGLVVEPGSAPALARAVAEIAGDPAMRKQMGRRGHELIVRDHSWGRRAEQTADLIERTLSTHSA
ncbi:MAG: glycosyltransferase family 4 protein [Xanthobacteraceae bacterium]|nr:glycosyltransferase family 4 protein [Xanthobacteraceae bacterium]